MSKRKDKESALTIQRSYFKIKEIKDFFLEEEYIECG